MRKSGQNEGRQDLVHMLFLGFVGGDFEVPRLMMIGQFEPKERSFGKSYGVLSKSTHKRKALGGSGNC